jgi:hypothetical protein
MMDTDPASKKLKAMDNVQINIYDYCNSYGASRSILRSWKEAPWVRFLYIHSLFIIFPYVLLQLYSHSDCRDIGHGKDSNNSLVTSGLGWMTQAEGTGRSAK